MKMSKTFKREGNILYLTNTLAPKTDNLYLYVAFDKYNTILYTSYRPISATKDIKVKRFKEAK